jgi:beta-1,4-mannooligosaccharide/beta-1,4-mannosyl-N-acetylglucosamine phosphorylase
MMPQDDRSTTERVLLGDDVPNMPWEPKPAGCKDVVWRHSGNPIIGLRPFARARSVYNSCVVPWEGAFVGVFRVDWLCMTPYLHVGRSPDGLRWDIEEDPITVISPDPALGELTFAYDPRVCRLEDRYYVTWCNAYYGSTIGQAWTTDFRTFHQMENAFLPYNRNGVLFPRKIRGQYAMLSRPMGLGMAVNYGDIFYSESPDLTYWGRHRIVFTRGPRKWERVKIGPGPVPIETREGWLLLYHGVSDTCDSFVYCMGAALLDLEEPWKVRYRCQFPIMSPETLYETAGYVGNVVFPTAALTDRATGRMCIYYGAADTYTALAYASVDEVVAYVKEHATAPRPA